MGKAASRVARTMTIEIIVPRYLYRFIMGYCKIAGLKPDEFMFAAMMYSMEKLMEEKNGATRSYIG